MTDAQPAELLVSARADAGDVWLETSGEIDISNAATWEKAIADGLSTGPDRIYLDMHLVSFIDSSGLAVLVKCHGLAAKQGSRLVVKSPAHQVERVLELARLDQYLAIES